MNERFLPATKDDLFLLGNLHIAIRCIHIFCRFPIADLIHKDQPSASQIASHFSWKFEVTEKVLRIMESLKLLTSDEKGMYSLTSTGEFLRHDHPESLTSMLFWDETRWSPLGELSYTLKEGAPAFDKIYGEDYFSYLGKAPEKQKCFDEHMRDVSPEENRILAEYLPLAPNGKICDFGGGDGGLIGMLRQSNSNVKLSLFDLPETIQEAKKHLPKDIECISGSFFNEIEQSFDQAILKRVLHDWDDKRCIQILKNIKKSLNNDGSLFVIESVLLGKSDSFITRMFDLFLLNVFGGKERTLKEYQELFSLADLTFEKMIDTPSSMKILIAKPMS